MNELISREDVGNFARQFFNDTIVVAPGCFDLLHVGHVRFLEAAKKHGCFLIVALNSDMSVRELKGEGRPIIPQNERAEMLLALECVDFVVIYDGMEHDIEMFYHPLIVAKGGDYAGKKTIGQDEIEKHGGRIVQIDTPPLPTTSSIVEKIRRER